MSSVAVSSHSEDNLASMPTTTKKPRLSVFGSPAEATTPARTSGYTIHAGSHNPLPPLRATPPVLNNGDKDLEHPDRNAAHRNKIFEILFLCGHYTAQFKQAPLGRRYYTHQQCPRCQREHATSSCFYKLASWLFGWRRRSGGKDEENDDQYRGGDSDEGDAEHDEDDDDDDGEETEVGTEGGEDEAEAEEDPKAKTKEEPAAIAARTIQWARSR